MFSPKTVTAAPRRSSSGSVDRSTTSLAATARCCLRRPAAAATACLLSEASCAAGRACRAERTERAVGEPDSRMDLWCEGAARGTACGVRSARRRQLSALSALSSLEHGVASASFHEHRHRPAGKKRGRLRHMPTIVKTSSQDSRLRLTECAPALTPMSVTPPVPAPERTYPIRHPPHRETLVPQPEVQLNSSIAIAAAAVTAAAQEPQRAQPVRHAHDEHPARRPRHHGPQVPLQRAAKVEPPAVDVHQHWEQPPPRLVLLLRLILGRSIASTITFDTNTRSTSSSASSNRRTRSTIKSSRPKDIQPQRALLHPPLPSRTRRPLSPPLVPRIQRLPRLTGGTATARRNRSAAAYGTP
ncbi:hypothetical protein ACCO45_004901 [Purpureocillium lilacinum]|uniref:Uncharacterized protein n=1 Tax=Purpureocillium lilacinum TaxID=33203 RepID=A0ACC4DV57_PURLI